MVDEANAEAVRRAVVARPVLVGLKRAGEALDGLGEHDLLHAGPPLPGWEQACGALRGSVLGTLVHLGLARDVPDAEALARSGRLRFLSANDHHAGATYGSVITRATPVFEVENRAFGNRAYASICEGRGKALRYGANDAETLARLAWLEGEFSTILGAALRLSDGIDLSGILVQALHMGDEGHSRQKAASALFTTAIAPYVLETGFGPKECAAVLDFLARNEIFFLPLATAAGKATMEPLEGIRGASVVTCMAANGVAFGIRVAGLGTRWIEAPVPRAQGAFFEGYGPDDANPVIGDSEIAETMGLGAFAMAAAPALARYVGGTPEEATALALEMYRITTAEHPRLTIPALGFRGTPLGIDVRKVVETGITPLFNTGIAHRTPGIGQIGAGFVRTPMACYEAALAELSA